MTTIKNLLYANFFLFLVAIILFGIGFYYHSLNSVILYILEFTVIFELVRTFNHYLKDGQLKVRYGIDAAIFYTIKELYIGFSQFKLTNDSELLVLGSIIMVVLMFLRFFNNVIIEPKSGCIDSKGN